MPESSTTRRVQLKRNLDFVDLDISDEACLLQFGYSAGDIFQGILKHTFDDACCVFCMQWLDSVFESD